MSTHPLRRPPRVPAAAGLLLAAALALAGCANSPGEVDPTGVDELTVPTPSPDPDDFVDTVDSEWFPLEPGSVQRWRVLGGAGGGVRVVVEEEPRTVAGVEATVVRTRATIGEEARPLGWSTETERDYFAQDVDGNVWWMGREGVWEAGVDGAMAGVFVPAEPRVGDGYRMALLEGVVADRAEVVEVEDDLVRLTVYVAVEVDAPEVVLGTDATQEIVLERGIGATQVEVGVERLERITDPEA
ncbi:hypothetical protein [Nocardioides sp. zg-DK7169]|uniref:hypothetical protein n=1 Tax=Nocardioides sp. zg-DK7169 TaxID=2736600 RepID=UPI00155267F5|nr:hypothetical protein [Nocardioides sp. zg-DK7169]NPC99039.1 hypothetical protein [Nocardioides sp. zg-DK7169]